jgi:hypothetical protein
LGIIPEGALTLSDGGEEGVSKYEPAKAVGGTYSVWLPVGLPETGSARNVYE